MLRDGLPRLLGHDLTGIYLYGSVLGDDFVSIRSDVDCIVMTERPLDEAKFGSLGEWLEQGRGSEPWLDRLQMSLLVRDRVLEEDTEACLYQFGQLSRSGSDGNPIIWLDYLQRGFRIIGPEPRSFLPTITRHELRRALERELGYLREEIVVNTRSKWRQDLTYLAYAVLTLCRILYSDATGSVTSKPEAAAWALDRVPEEFRDLIRRARALSTAEELVPVAPTEIARFIEYVEAGQPQTDA